MLIDLNAVNEKWRVNELVCALRSQSPPASPPAPTLITERRAFFVWLAEIFIG
jgi:hypothetical protein